MEPYDSVLGKVWNEKQIFELLYSNEKQILEKQIYKDLGFQLLQTMFAVWNRVRHFRIVIIRMKASCLQILLF